MDVKSAAALHALCTMCKLEHPLIIGRAEAALDEAAREKYVLRRLLTLLHFTARVGTIQDVRKITERLIPFKTLAEGKIEVSQCDRNCHACGAESCVLYSDGVVLCSHCENTSHGVFGCLDELNVRQYLSWNSIFEDCERVRRPQT